MPIFNESFFNCTYKINFHLNFVESARVRIFANMRADAPRIGYMYLHLTLNI